MWENLVVITLLLYLTYASVGTIYVDIRFGNNAAHRFVANLLMMRLIMIVGDICEVLVYGTCSRSRD